MDLGVSIMFCNLDFISCLQKAEIQFTTMWIPSVFSNMNNINVSYVV